MLMFSMWHCGTCAITITVNSLLIEEHLFAIINIGVNFMNKKEIVRILASTSSTVQ